MRNQSRAVDAKEPRAVLPPAIAPLMTPSGILSDYARKFSSKRCAPNREQGIGHNLPQESPAVPLPKAIVDVKEY